MDPSALPLLHPKCEFTDFVAVLRALPRGPERLLVLAWLPIRGKSAGHKSMRQLGGEAAGHCWGECHSRPVFGKEGLIE
jgi:hypothetical protein